MVIWSVVCEAIFRNITKLGEIVMFSETWGHGDVKIDMRLSPVGEPGGKTSIWTEELAGLELDPAVPRLSDKLVTTVLVKQPVTAS